MSGFNPEGQSDGDWDERGDLAWNEFDWQRYLQKNEQEIARFINLYQKMRSHPNRLDEIAHVMGWDQEDWSPSEEAERMMNEEEDWEEVGSAEEEIEDDSLDPYTVHRHPVYIVTQGLFRHLNEGWQFLMTNATEGISAQTAWRIGQAFNNTQQHAVMGISALDLGDYSLCVAHLKNTLSGINECMNILQELPGRTDKVAAFYMGDAHLVLFDMRDLYIRVMSECREESRRGFKD